MTWILGFLDGDRLSDTCEWTNLDELIDGMGNNINLKESQAYAELK